LSSRHARIPLAGAVIALYFGSFNPCRAISAPVLPAYRMPSPPIIDGNITDAEWANVPSGKGGFDSQDGHAAPEPMQFWLAYDENYIYFAARLGDRNPRSIHALQYQTNVDLSGDDNVQFYLDLNGSLADGNVFGINSRGATSVSLAGGRADKREWNGDILAKGRVTSTGWEVEARISWHMMRLPKAGVRDVRFNVSRFLPRDQRTYAFAYTQSGHQADTPVWQAVPIPNRQQTRTLKLLPYMYAGYDPAIGTVFNSGLDMKTELTDTITLVGTLNPDFRNIQNQILSLDFSRYLRLPGETRPFFQEGSQFMSSALYASQLITSVDAGLNAYGRLNDRTSFGIVETTRVGQVNDFVGNVTFDPNPKDSYRFTMTDVSQPGLESTAYLARYSRQVGPISLFARSMGSEDSQTGGAQYDTASAYYAKKEWNAGIEYDWASPKFEARLGYLPEIDFKGPSYNFGYDKVFPKGSVGETSINYNGVEYTHIDGTQYRRHNEVDSFVALRNRSLLTLNYYTERFDGENDHLMQAALMYPRDDLFRNFSVEYDHGMLALVPYASISATATYRLGKRFQASARYQQVHHGDIEDQLILTGSYDLTHDRSLSGRVVQSNSEWNAYVSFRQSGNRGVEYYLIVGDPNALEFRPSIIAKVVVPIDVSLSRATRSQGQ